MAKPKAASDTSEVLPPNSPRKWLWSLPLAVSSPKSYSVCELTEMGKRRRTWLPEGGGVGGAMLGEMKPGGVEE